MYQFISYFFLYISCYTRMNIPNKNKLEELFVLRNSWNPPVSYNTISHATRVISLEPIYRVVGGLPVSYNNV